MTEPSELLLIVERATLALASKLEQLSFLLPANGDHDPRDDAVRSMAGRAAHFATACALLASHLNEDAVVVLNRALLENLITLLWILENPANAEAFRIEGLNELRRAARKSMQKGLLGIIDRLTGLDHSQEFLARAEYKKIPKRKTVEDRAREAGVDDLYCVFYGPLSLELHGHPLKGIEEPPAAVMCRTLQTINAFLNCTALAADNWLSKRNRPSNEQLRGALGLPHDNNAPG